MTVSEGNGKTEYPVGDKNKESCFTSTPIVIQSRDLFGSETNKMITIQHRDIFYRLMITRQGKLILTK